MQWTKKYCTAAKRSELHRLILIEINFLQSDPYTHEETGIFLFKVPPRGGFLLDFRGELDPITKSSEPKK